MLLTRLLSVAVVLPWCSFCLTIFDDSEFPVKLIQVTRIETKVLGSNQSFNIRYFQKVQDILRHRFYKNWNSQNNFYVPTPGRDCVNDHDCGSGMQCENHRCKCSDGLCWIYELEPSTFIPKYSYSCGECGNLGSQCQMSDDSSCNPPGRCYIDSFCHCPYGEHVGPDICVVTDIKKLIVLFLGGFVVFAILGLTVLGYTCFLSYRRTGNFFWCREYRRRRRNVPHRINPANGMLKTPAFTIESLYQFGSKNLEEDLESSTHPAGDTNRDPTASTSSSQGATSDNENQSPEPGNSRT